MVRICSVEQLPPLRKAYRVLRVSLAHTLTISPGCLTTRPSHKYWMVSLIGGQVVVALFVLKRWLHCIHGECNVALEPDESACANLSGIGCVAVLDASGSNSGTISGEKAVTHTLSELSTPRGESARPLGGGTYLGLDRLSRLCSTFTSVC